MCKTRNGDADAGQEQMITLLITDVLLVVAREFALSLFCFALLLCCREVAGKLIEHHALPVTVVLDGSVRHVFVPGSGSKGGSRRR